MKKAEIKKAIDNKEFYNQSFCGAFFTLERSGNELLDFNDVIWEHDIVEMLELCRKYEIEEFTISSLFSNLIPTLAKLEEYGCTMEGLTKVYAPYKGIVSGEKVTIPAIKIKVA